MFDEEDDVPIDGLTAGQAPQHEDIFEEVVPGEVPDLKEGLTVLVGLESRLQDLQYLSEAVRESGGMSQSFALEAMKLVPDFGGQTPLSYYTKAPSATRYKPALEEISKAVWALIAAAAAAVAAAIAKFIAWFRQHNADNEASSAEKKKQTAAANNDALHACEQKVNDLKDILHSGHTSVNDAQGNPTKPITMQSLLDDLWGEQTRFERAKRFLDVANPIHHDIIYRGPYTQAFRSVTPALSHITDVLRQKLAIVEKISRSDQLGSSSLERMTFQRSLEMLSTPLELRFKGGMRSLSEVTDALAQARQQAQTQHLERPLEFDKFIYAVADAYRSSEIVSFFEEQAEVVDIFGDLDGIVQILQKNAGTVATDGKPEQNSQSVGPLIRQVIFAIGQDVNAYRRLFAELATYGAYLERLAQESVGFARELELHILKMAAAGKITIPEDWRVRASKRKPGVFERVFSKGMPNGEV